MTLVRRAAVSFGILVLAGCSASTPSTPSSRTASASSAATSSPSVPASEGPQYYVSIGDSYAAGYQPSGTAAGATTRNGFAYQLIATEAARGRRLTLVNFGCSGATTASVLHSVGCPAKDLGPGASAYRQTQASVAEAFLRTHRGQVALATVVIGGNDLLDCGRAASPLTCLSTALTGVESNLADLLDGLRAAAGPTTRIVGLTYPDVLLAGLLSADAQAKSLAALSVDAFRDLVNPALKRDYDTAGATFLDVTAATGAYGSLSATTALAPYGTIPVPVASVCRLTYSCQYADIHPKTAGYALIAGLIANTLH